MLNYAGEAVPASRLTKYRPHDCTTAQRPHCVVAGRIPFAACMKTASKTSLCKYVFISPLIWVVA